MRTIDLHRLSQLIGTQEDIAAALVFGSAQDGIVREGSDVDIAVLFQTSPIPERLYNLMADMTEAIQFDKIDLAVLNKAHCILAFEALQGKRLHVNDISLLASFSSLTAREYEDTMANIDYQKKLRHAD